MIGERLHRRFFTMNKKRSLASANAAVPCKQFLLICVSRESIDRVDRAADWNVFAEEVYVPGSVDDLSCNRASGCKSNEDDR